MTIAASRDGAPRAAATNTESHPRTVKFVAAMDPAELANRLFGEDFATLRSVGGMSLTLAPYISFDTIDARAALSEAEVLITGWGAAPLTDQHFDAAPLLRYVLHAGGDTRALLPQSVRSRGIQVSSAGWINAIPVAEFTFAMIVLANKQAFRARQLYRDQRGAIDRELQFPTAGNTGKTIGIVGASRIGRIVIERLASIDVAVLLYDPFVSPAEAERLGVRQVSLDELMAMSDVVSLHPPLNAMTEGMIDARRLALLRDGRTLINTSRGRIVDQDALLTELRAGRIDAVIDVTYPEVLPKDSAFYELPNVFLTPHISGSTGGEIRRLGDHVASELSRIVNGQSLAFPEGNQ